MPDKSHNARRAQEERKLVSRLLNQTHTASVGIYPHDIHPGLVPGISVDEQRNRFGTDKFVFTITAALLSLIHI